MGLGPCRRHEGAFGLGSHRVLTLVPRLSSRGLTPGPAKSGPNGSGPPLCPTDNYQEAAKQAEVTLNTSAANSFRAWGQSGLEGQAVSQDTQVAGALSTLDLV